MKKYKKHLSRLYEATQASDRSGDASLHPVTHRKTRNK